MNNDILKEVHRISEEIFLDNYRPILDIYMDITVLQDFTIGAIMAHCDNSISHDIIKSKIEAYNNKTNDKIANIFKPCFADNEFLTDEYLKEYIANPENHKALSILSPFTDVYNNLRKYITVMELTKLRIHTNKPPTIRIGLCGINYDKSLLKRLTSVITKHNEVRLIVYEGDVTTISPSDRLSTDLFIIGNLQDFFNNETVATEFFKEEMYKRKYIYAKLICNKYTTDEEYADAICNTQEGLQVFSDLYFRDTKINLTGA